LTHVKLVSDDALSEITLRIRPDFELGYGEPAEGSIENHDEDARRVLVVILGVAPDGEREYVAFSELLPLQLPNASIM
jgi:hypothetical protein